MSAFEVSSGIHSSREYSIRGEHVFVFRASFNLTLTHRTILFLPCCILNCLLTSLSFNRLKTLRLGSLLSCIGSFTSALSTVFAKPTHLPWSAVPFEFASTQFNPARVHPGQRKPIQPS
ncbi:hypothetical protein B0H16DRAFT_1022314 [Mycena metata]|uniref:Uncharacterized protein n=1 Tax=Mycena metata TaxID=1033252 RepID=A0AAD7N2B4_9AGAR|nr:hypothetical protein B0H16DRAFT_637046 [Mycena metata]KAJ7742625.1 hypothetical protein B0H16DRAFT_1022314 [Mycena metata]